MEAPRVAIVVLNWNSWQDTIECLESLQQVRYPSYQVVVVDNGSINDSLEKIKAWAEGDLLVNSRYVKYDSFAKPVHLKFYDRIEAERGGTPEEEIESILSLHRRLIIIKTGDNLGFAEGNNVGIRYALASRIGFEYICLLNNDTVVEPDFLIYLVRCAEKDGAIGIVGGKVLFYDDPSRVWYGGGYVSLWGRGPGYVSECYGRRDSECGREARFVTFVTGCLMLIRRSVFEKVGLLDPYMFFGGEDADFCLRTLRSSFKIKYEPRAVIYHRAARTYDPASRSHIYYVYRGKTAFLKKHLPKVWVLWVVGFGIYLLCIAPVRTLLRTRSLHFALNVLLGGVRALKDGVRGRRSKKVER